MIRKKTLFLFLPAVFAACTLAVAQTPSITVTTFEGIDAISYQGAGLNVDPNGVVGSKQFFEWVNPVYQAFDKTTGKPVASTLQPVDGSTPWRGKLPDCVGPSGNGELIYDKLAKRWVLGRRQGGGTYFFCIAVSTADDISSSLSWYPYEFALNSALGTNAQGHAYYPDYPKISTWPDAYYVTIDLEDPDEGYTEVGIVACAFDRTNMIAGTTMRPPQCFRYPKQPSGLFYSHSLLPADYDGKNTPPTGTPEVFLSIQNPQGSNTTSNTLNLWQFHVDWANPKNSVFKGPTVESVPTYTQGCYSVSLPTNTVCVPEPSSSHTNNYIDSVGDRLMQRLTYRRFTGSAPYSSYTVAQTVQVGSGAQSQTGVAWYEFRNTGAIHSGVINPDSTYRFMPSAAQNKTGDLAIGYSTSSSSQHPGISASYLNLQTGSTPTEITLFPGTADEENSFHWGVYTEMSVDPADDCTFWYVNEYFDTNQLTNPTWQTRISHFAAPDCP